MLDVRLQAEQLGRELLAIWMSRGAANLNGELPKEYTTGQAQTSGTCRSVLPTDRWGKSLALSGPPDAGGGTDASPSGVHFLPQARTSSQ